MDYRVTQLSSADWQKYRTIRLDALQCDPLAFASSYEEEHNLPEEVWRMRINNMWFAINKNQPIAMVGLIRPERQASIHVGTVVSMWTRPEYQRLGIARALMHRVQEVALSMGIKKLLLEVTITQVSAIKFYESMGFKQIALLKQNLFKNDEYLDEYLMEWLSPV
jgi:ribosomal protein S18 acetylase RimI-like enzyme